MHHQILPNGYKCRKKFWVEIKTNFWKNLAATQKSLQKVDKTQFPPLWWVFLCGFNRFKPGG